MTPGSTPPAAGWFPDPWGASTWRWWTGSAWSATTADATGSPSGHPVAEPGAIPGATHGSTPAAVGSKRPRLPHWLSPPVVAAGAIVIPGIVVLAITSPVSIALGLVPLVIVFPVLAWLDRIEPEPRSSRIHALLWGATAAPLVAGIVNTGAASALGDSFAAVVSAPVIEELMKGLGVVWAVRRKEVDDLMDGIVYAGWIGLGFAITEDFLYFTTAHEEGQLVGVFVVRALLTPFAHPLFTAWIGLAVGRAIVRKAPMRTAWWGYLVAVGTHAAWNGSLTLTDQTASATILLVAAVAFVGLFVGAAALCVVVRRGECRRFIEAAPDLARRYGLNPAEVAVFGSWRTIRTVRRQVPRATRRDFDALHASLARLAALQSRGALGGVDEARHVEVLGRSRELLRRGAA